MTAMNCLVTGVTGFVGGPLAKSLISQGYSVRATVRDAAASVPLGAQRFVTGSMHDKIDWSAAVAGMDVVIHAAARAHVLEEPSAGPLAAFRRVNRDATIDLARAAIEASVKRMIFVSTIQVNGEETSGRPFTYRDAPAPKSPYAIAKMEAEQGLWSLVDGTSLKLAIIRPPLVIAADAKGNLASLCTVIDSGLPLPFGLVTHNRRSLVSRHVLIDCIIRMMEHPSAAGQTFLVSDGQPYSTRSLIERLASLRRKPARLLPVPVPLMDACFRMLGKDKMASQLLGDLEIDIEHTCRTLDWLPPATDFVE